jgi:hypothetical protein
MKELLSLVLDVAKLAVAPAGVHIPAGDGFGSIDGLACGAPPPLEPRLGGPPCDPPPRGEPPVANAP